MSILHLHPAMDLALRQLEVELDEHVPLHFQYLVTRVSLVRNVDKVAALRRVYLLVLGGEEHGGDAHQLQLVARDGLLLPHATTNGNGRM